MQTSTYYVQTKSNLGRIMFAMIIVYINNVLVISCLSPKPSVMDLYLLIILIGIHITVLYSTKEVFLFTSDFLIFKVDLFLGKIFLRILFTRKITKN